MPDDSNGRADRVSERPDSGWGHRFFDAVLQDRRQLLAAVGSATSLGLENQSRQQQLREQLVEVRRPRERILAAGDSRRRQLERIS